jgi:hypothetical protein
MMPLTRCRIARRTPAPELGSQLKRSFVIELDIATRSGGAVAVIVSLRMVVVLVIRGIATHLISWRSRHLFSRLRSESEEGQNRDARRQGFRQVCVVRRHC